MSTGIPASNLMHLMRPWLEPIVASVMAGNTNAMEDALEEFRAETGHEPGSPDTHSSAELLSYCALAGMHDELRALCALPAFQPFLSLHNHLPLRRFMCVQRGKTDAVSLSLLLETVTDPAGMVRDWLAESAGAHPSPAGMAFPVQDANLVHADQVGLTLPIEVLQDWVLVFPAGSLPHSEARLMLNVLPEAAGHTNRFRL
jgi:hypothetical protein